MSAPTLIAVHGLKYAGKGTVADRLIIEHGYARAKFAGALKDMSRVVLTLVCGLDEAAVERCVEGDLKEVPIPALGGKSTRYLMQMLGTEWRDAVHTDMWTLIALTTIRGLVAEGGRVVVDDLRFPHEVALLRIEDARLWMVESNRVHGASGVLVLPWEAGAPATMDVGQDVLDEMLGRLLSHCGLSSVDVLDAVSGDGDAHRAPLTVLGGRSAAHCARTLRSVWLPLMKRPWTSTPSATATHVSEQGLPAALFDVRLRNDGSFDDLHRQVDAAILGKASLAAPCHRQPTR